MAIRKPLVIVENRTAQLPVGDALSAADVDIAGVTEIDAALVDSDGIAVYDASATAIKKSLLSRVWTYISGKLTGAISGVLTSNLTASRAVVSDGSGKVSASSVTSTELGYLSGVTSAVQTQINAKAPSASPSFTGVITLQNTDINWPTLGAELLTSDGWTANTGWTESPDDVFTHSSGTGTLTHAITATVGWKYHLSWTITGRTTGSVTISIGGQSFSAIVATSSTGPTATTTGGLVVTPTSDFNGSISLSLKRITGVSPADRVAKNSVGAVVYEERTRNALTVFSGINCGSHNTTGSWNTFQGNGSGYFNTSGSYNTFQGAASGYNNTTGSYNTFQGNGSGQFNTSGSNNTFHGSGSGNKNTTGSGNTFHGTNCGYNNTTGANNVFQGTNCGSYNTTGNGNIALGYFAGRLFADGATSLTTPNYSIYIGYTARGKDNSDNNSVVIGGNLPIGLGANTTVLGTSATTLTRIFGNLLLGTSIDDASGAVLQCSGTVNLATGNAYKINNVQIINARKTGWAAATGTATRSTFDTSTVTTEQLAERVKALLDDLISHGLLGS
jgi:hypothetical protein